jgi:hypothetical protein
VIKGIKKINLDYFLREDDPFEETVAPMIAPTIVNAA